VVVMTRAAAKVEMVAKAGMVGGMAATEMMAASAVWRR
jgi:hypothetical protein